MNVTFRYILVSTMAVAGVSALYADNTQPNLPVVEILGAKYYVYKARKGDSLFGVARTYGWDDATLSRLNPTAENPLKKGMLLYYPTGELVKPAASAAAVSNPEMEDLHHKVKRGETVYAISKMYGVPVDRLYSLNPSSKNGIKAGDDLLIRKSEPQKQADNNGKSVFYSVKKGDTLYSLSQAFGVSVAAIMESNPGVDENNFRAGSTVKIPKRGTGLVTTVKPVQKSRLDSVEMRQVSKNDTWSSLAEELQVSEQLLKEANPQAKLKNKEYVAVPKVDVTTVEKEVIAEDPRETTAGGLSLIYEDVHNVVSKDSVAVYTVKVAVVADAPTGKKDQEFIRGFLAGMDRFKNSDYKVDLKVINGTEPSAQIVGELEDFRPSLVFSTSETDLPQYLAQYSLTNRVPLINTFDVKSFSYTDNPYVIQLLTPPSLFNDNVAHYVYERFGDRTIVFVGDEDKNDQLAEALYALWDISKIKTFGSVESVVPEMFGDEGKYLIYGYDVKKGDVQKLAQAVANVREMKPLADISMLGRPNLIMFEESLADEFKKADLKLPSRFYIDKDSREYREFMTSYRSLWDRTPVKSLPLYAAVGYDTAIYFVPAIGERRGDINGLPASKGTVQSDFELYRPSNWSGLLNPPVYMIDYTPVGSVTKNVIYYAE